MGNPTKPPYSQTCRAVKDVEINSVCLCVLLLSLAVTEACCKFCFKPLLAH
jgi:hypothetical protein